LKNIYFNYLLYFSFNFLIYFYLFIWI